MKKYVCTRNVSHDNQPYEEGDEIELEKKHADPLLAVGAIEDPEAKEKKPAKAKK